MVSVGAVIVLERGVGECRHRPRFGGPLQFFHHLHPTRETPGAPVSFHTLRAARHPRLWSDTIDVMKRLLKSVIAAAVGSAAGFAVYQKKRLHRDQDGEAPGDVGHAEVVVAAPPANVAAATLAGLITGKPKVAFIVGFGVSAAMGDELEAKLRG